MKKKRMLALLLTLTTMLIAMAALTVTSFADGNVAKIGETEYATLQEAITAANGTSATAESPVVVNLLKDTTVTEAIMISNNITINGNNNVITTTANRGFRIDRSNVKATVKDLTITGAKLERAVQVDYDETGISDVTLVIDGVTAEVSDYTVNICNKVSNLNLSVSNSNLTGYGVINLWGNNGSVNITNSTLNGINKASYNADGWNDFGTVIVEGDTTGQTDTHATAYNVSISNTIIVANQTKGNHQTALLYNNPSVNNAITLNGCTIVLGNNCSFLLDQGDESTTKVKDTKDRTTNEIPTLPDGYIYVDINDGYKLVTNAVAKIGETKYPSLAAAIAAVDNNETVKLLDDVAISEKIVINNGKTFTLDLNGKTLTGVTNGRTFDLQNAFLTVKNGTMTGASQPFNVYGSNNSSYGAGSFNSLTLENNLTVNGDYAVILWYPRYGAPAYGTKIDVNGATLNGNIWVLGAIEEGNSVINVNNGTTINVVSNDGDDVGIAVQGNAIVNVNEGVTISAPTGIEVAGGTLNMMGGTVTGTAKPTSTQGNNNGTTTIGAGIAVAPYGYSTPTVNISGGVINGYTALNVANPRNITNEFKTPKVSVSNGSFAAINEGTAAVSVASGVELSGFIYGGKFSTEPVAEHLATGCTASAITEAPYLWKVTMNSISGETSIGNETPEETPIAVNITDETAKLQPIVEADLDKPSNAGKTTDISQSDLEAFADSNELNKVEIVTGLSATQEVGGAHAPQTIIKDDEGNTIFEAVARGGQLRVDNKWNGNDFDTSTIDLRLQYNFTLPEGVDITDPTTTWKWDLNYEKANGDSYHRVVDGVKYVATGNNQYESNIVVTNVPITVSNGYYKTCSFKVNLTISYVLDGVTYEITQSESVPLARTEKGLLDYYSSDAGQAELNNNKMKDYIQALLGV